MLYLERQVNIASSHEKKYACELNKFCFAFSGYQKRANKSHVLMNDFVGKTEKIRKELCEGDQ